MAHLLKWFLSAAVVAVLAVATFRLMGPQQMQDTTHAPTNPLLPPTISLPALPVERAKAEFKEELVGLAKLDGDSPYAAAAADYRTRSTQAIEGLERLAEPLAKAREALSQGDYEAAAEVIQPNLLGELKETIQEVEQAADMRDELVANEVLPQQQAPAEEEEQKDWWDTVLKVLETILRIIFLILLVFGNGDGSTGSDTGAGAAEFGADSGATAMDAFAIGGATNMANAVVQMVGDETNGQHVVSTTTGRNGEPVILLALDKNLSAPLELPVTITRDDGQPHELVDAFRRGAAQVKEVVAHSDDTVTLRIEFDEQSYQIRWNYRGKLLPQVEAGR